MRGGECAFLKKVPSEFGHFSLCKEGNTNTQPFVPFAPFVFPSFLSIENSRRDGRILSAPGCAFQYSPDRQYRCNRDHPLPHCSFESPLCIADPRRSQRNADPFYR